jgi:heme-NO-binding protein
MKGIIFNLLEEAFTAEHGEDAWDDLLRVSGTDGAYTSLGRYPDQELVTLVGAAADVRGESVPDCLRWFGREAMARLAGSYSTFFVDHYSLRTFLPTINEVIHAEVRKLYPGADTPWFDVDEDGDALQLVYASPRRLCPLAEGLIEGAAARFGESVVIHQPECMLRGDARCVLVCSLQPRSG